MKTAAFILLLMYWGSDGRSAMTSAEYTSQQTCEAARQAAAKIMDSSLTVLGSKTYAVCTEK